MINSVKLLRMERSYCGGLTGNREVTEIGITKKLAEISHFSLRLEVNLHKQVTSMACGTSNLDQPSAKAVYVV